MKPTKTAKKRAAKAPATAKPNSKAPGAEDVSPRIARRERRRDRSREEIVEAARRVLLKKGIAAATLDAVAKEVGLTKAALYYYYPSKDALFFEIIYGAVEAQAHAIHDRVLEVKTGGEALAAIVRETVRSFAPHMDDFRLTFLLSQLSPGAATLGAEQFTKLRPLNDLAYGGATKLLTEEWNSKPGRARVEPRLLAFLAFLSAIGLLTMKGMVESFGDPLLYSDEQLVEAFAQVFRAA
ncbi:MAG: helix-turn-helix domain-containing protein, partial [Polyangiaceae bacterium]